MVLFFCCRCVIAPSSQGNEWFISQSCRLTHLSRALERCIIHIVDWSLFCTSGVHREKVESTLRCARPNSPESCIFLSLILSFKSQDLLSVNELMARLSSSHILLRLQGSYYFMLGHYKCSKKKSCFQPERELRETHQRASVPSFWSTSAPKVLRSGPLKSRPGFL